MDIGESLVGAYFRHERQCHTVAFNQFLPGKQGEIDVIGISGEGVDQHVWLAEVAVHLDDLNYGGYSQTVTKVATRSRRPVNTPTTRTAVTSPRSSSGRPEFRPDWAPCSLNSMSNWSSTRSSRDE